jgi:hypothetical protein
MQAASSVQTIPLLSTKKFLVIANIAEEDLGSNAYELEHIKSVVNRFGKDRVIALCAKVEYELSQLNKEDEQEMMGMFNLAEPGLERVIRQTYANLGLITFFTCGPQEIHAWPIKKGMTVRQASGEIHSDLERGFICAEVFNCSDLFALGSIQAIKERGKIRTEGQGYVVQDGDIIHVKFNV